MILHSYVPSHRRPPRTGLRAFVGVAVAAVLLSGLADSSCKTEKAPPPSLGHDRDRPGQPDPAPHAPTPSRRVVQLRFTVEANVPTVVTYNAGHGNKFLENIRFDVWYAPSYVGATAYLGAVPARRDTRGTIHVKIDYGTDDRLVCFDTNFANTRAGADCQGKVK
jgi:hypothetical protein